MHHCISSFLTFLTVSQFLDELKPILALIKYKLQVT